MLIKSLTPLRPNPARVKDIVSQPFDVVDTGEARLRLRDNRASFLHVVRSEIDFPDGTDPASEAVLLRARKNLESMVSEGLYFLDNDPAFYIYRLNRGEHQQTGVALRVSVDDYLENRVRRHEMTRPERVASKALHIDRVGANTGPIFLSYDSEKRSDLTGQIDTWANQNNPLYDVTMPNGIRHRVYRVNDIELHKLIDNSFSQMESLYIADGHHRAASAVEASLIRRKRYPQYNQEDDMNFFLAVCFPEEQLRILPIHRVIDESFEHNPSIILAEILERFPLLERSDSPLSPRRGETVLFMNNNYYRIDLETGDADSRSPVEQLDVFNLHTKILSPIFGIDDSTRSKEIHFVGGLQGDTDSVEMVKRGGGMAAFLLHPVTAKEVRHVADAGLTLPPKATWFDPKMRSGFLVNPLDSSYGKIPGTQNSKVR